MRNLYAVQFVGIGFEKELPKWYHLKYFAGFSGNGMVLLSNTVDKAYLTIDKEIVEILIKKLHKERGYTFHVVCFKEQILPARICD